MKLAGIFKCKTKNFMSFSLSIKLYNFNFDLDR